MEFWYHGMTEPICSTSSWTKKWDGDKKRKYSYSRTSNPNFDILERKITALYDCDESCLFPSGISAISTIFYKYASPESLFMVGNELYDDTYMILDHLKIKFPGFDYVMIDVTSTEELIKTYNGYQNKINLLFFEACTNPSGKIIDFDILKMLIQQNPKMHIVIDNTWLTPFILNPFDYGVTFVVDSLTKYFAGGNCIMGVVAGSQDEMMCIKKQQSIFGLHVSPFDAWNISQMVDTAKLRLFTVSKLSKKIAQYLESHKNVNRVHYPLLNSHNSYERASKFFKSEGGEKIGPGVLFYHISLSKDETIKRVNDCKNLHYATSYGKPHSTINPYIYEGDSNFYDNMCEGISVNGVWVRLAVGWNCNFGDLCKDLDSLVC